MKIALISYLSEISNRERIDSTLTDVYQSLNSNFEITEIDAESVPYHDFSGYDLSLNFIKSGGSENSFAEVYSYLDKPVYLLATALHNSLPAALEILSYVNAKGQTAEILHGEMDEIIPKLKKLAEYKSVRDSIADARIGVIGRPSDWLIGSWVDYEHAEHHWGTEFVDIKLDELYRTLDDIDSLKAEQTADELIDSAEEMVENSREELIQALEIYYGLKKLIKKNELTAITLRCFDIVQQLNNTGCLALSMLNNEGIIAGCEGDIPAVFTMYMAYKLTGQVPFMANPASIDSKKDEILFAHCTVATDIAESYKLRSHFETGIGVGIQGIMEKGPVTVFKIGGEGLEQYFAAEGQITENMNSENACRTQIKVDLPASSDYFLNDSIGNHHILIPGNHSKVINEFLGME